MAVRDYSGFQAIVTSVEKLRETVTIEADKQLSVFRAIRDTQNSQLKVLERMVEGLRTRSQTRNNFGFPDRLELKNVRLQAGTVTLTARSVIVETKGGLSREKQSKADSQELAKSVGQQLKKITFKTSERIDPIKNITLGFLQYGVGGTLGNRFTRGVEQGTGINSRFLGKQIGKAARYPLVLANEFKKGFFDEDNQVKFKDKEDPDENTGNSSSSPPKKPSGGSGGTNSKTFGNNLLEKFIYQEGQKLSNKVDRKNSVHALIDAWATWSKEKNLRFAIPQFIEKMRQKSDKESFGDKEINEALEKRKDFLKEEIAKEEKLPDNQKIKINETRQKKQLLSPKEQLAYIEFLEKDRKDLYKKLGKLLFRFRGQNKLKFEELMAIYYYTESQGYKEMNQVLREQSKPLAEDLNIKEENLISSADKNIKVATSGLNRLPGFKGKTYRGLDFASIGIDPNEHYKVGQIIEEKGFTSTTKNQTMRYPGNVVWEINAKKGGKDISEIEAFTNEEVLFPPNSKFKVTGKRHVKKFGRDFWVIELDDVNEETADLPNVQNDFEKKQSQALTDEVSSSSPQASNSNVKTPQPQPQRKTRKKQNANISNVKLQVKPNDTNQIPIKQDTSGRPDGSRNQSPDRNPDIIPVGPVELPIGPRDTVAIEADSTRGGGIVPLAGRLDTYQKTLKESLAGVLEAQKAQTEIEIEPGFWVDVEQLNQGFVNKTQRRLILFWEKLRVNLGKEINRTLAGLLGTIPGAVIGRGLTGDPAGGFLGGMAGRLIAETGFQDVSNFRSLQQQGLSPATAEFWQQFGQNRKSLSNTLRKTAVGYVTGSVVGRGIGDVMQATGANRVIGALMPSWLEDAIGDGVNRTIKTIADPNIDLAIPHLPPVANRILSAPLHAVGNSVAAQGFLGNMGLSFLDNQAKTALMPVREALTGAGQAIGGDGFFGEYLGNRFTGIGIEAIQDTAKASGRGVAGMIAPGLPAEVRNFIADQVIKQGVLDGTVRDQVAPFLASRAGTDVFARGIKVPITGKVAGGVNKFLDKYDPYAIAPQPPLTDEQILLNREQRLTKKRTTAINAIENLFNRIDKSVDETTKAVVGIGNGFLGFFDNIRSKTYDFAKQTAGLADNPVTLVDQYAVYLDKLIQDAQKQAEETIKGIIPDYKKLTIPERKEAIGSYKEKVATEVKKFRMAIEDGESQIALEIGENILALVQSTRKVYKDLLEAVPSDLSGTKSIQANQRYLTNVQTEVLKGQPNLKGRAKTGLMQLVGTETSEGFIKGIEDKLTQVRNSGEELAESAIEGAKKRLGISSPSKEFEKLGKSSGEGFQIGAVESLQDASKAILAEIEKIKAEVAKELKGIVKPSKLDKFLAEGPSKTLTTKGLDAVIYRLNNSFNLKPEHQKMIDRLALYGRTQKPSIIRMHGSDQKHKIGESVEFPSGTSFTGKVDQVKKTGSVSYLKLQPGGSLYEVVNPKRGFDVPYGDSSYNAPFAEEDETITSGKYKVVGKKQKTISVNYGEKDGIEKLKVAIYQLEEIRSEIDRSISLLSKPIAQLKSAFDKLGKDTVEGFVQGVQGDQSDAIDVIAEVIDLVIEKAKDDLEIQSPSRVFEQIGKWVVEGFNKGVDGITKALSQPVQQAITTTDNIFADFIGNVRQSFDEFFDFLFGKFPVLKELTDLFLAFGTGFLVSNVLETLVGWFTDIANSSFDAVIQLESLQLALTSVTGSAEAGAKGLAFVRSEAQRLGVELKTAEEAYTGFLAVTKYTTLQGNQADRIFSAFQETAARRGLSNEEQGRMFAAINQAISKRKLSAEEVRGQLGEIPGLAFESTLARSMGVNPAQLSEMMSDGLLMAEDVFPKVAALYEAENASISASAETTTQKLNRLNNAILVLQRSFADWIDKFKILFDIGTATIEGLTNLIPGFIKALTTAGLTVFLDNVWGVVEAFKGFKSLQALVVNFFKAVASLIQYVLPHIITFLGKFALLTLAFDAVGAAIYVLSNNAFPELKKGIEEATTRANQLEQALQNVKKATQAIPTELPKTEEEIVTNRTWNILGWDTGFNLEGTRQFLNNVDKAFGFEPTLTTLGQQELANFQENVGGLLSQVNSNLMEQFNVEKVIKEIRELDKELTKARSRQFNISAGDKKAYEAAIAEQQKLMEEIDKRFDVTANYETALQNSKARIE